MVVRRKLHYKADAGAGVDLFLDKCHSRVIDVGKWKAGWQGRTDRLAKCWLSLDRPSNTRHNRLTSADISHDCLRCIRRLTSSPQLPRTD